MVAGWDWRSNAGPPGRTNVGILARTPPIRWAQSSAEPVPLRIVLVRHGLSSFNVEHRIQGRYDLSSLTASGQSQACATGAALRDLYLGAAYCSPLRRAADTALLLLAEQGQGLVAKQEEGLLEIDLAPWSGLLREELRERYPEQEQQWRQAPELLELQRPDGSPYLPLQELIDKARQFRHLLLERHAAALIDDQAPPQTVLVVAHNAILRCLVLHLLGLPASGFQRLRLDNASISVLNLVRGEVGRGSVQIESLNGTSHLGAPLPPAGVGFRLLLVRHGETDWNR